MKTNGAQSADRHTMSVRMSLEGREMLEQLAHEEGMKLGHRVSYNSMLEKYVRDAYKKLPPARRKALKQAWGNRGNG